MSLRFMDGFKHYTTDDVLKKWTNVEGVTVYPVGGPTGGGYLSWGGPGGWPTRVLRKSLDPQATWIIGVRFLWPGAAMPLHSVWYAGSTQAHISVNGDGNIIVYSGDDREIGRTSAPPLTANVWCYIEMKVFISTTAGTIDVRVNGDDVLNFTALNTNPVGTLAGSATSVGMGSAFSLNGSFTDFYACDGQGSVNNDFLGDVEVQTIYPDGDGFVSDWASLSGPNWTGVDEQVADGDGSYVYANVSGKMDLYTYSDITELSGVVHGIQHNVWARKVTSGTVRVAPVTRADASNVAGPSASLSQSYTDALSVEETNPETGLPWTISQVNAAQFGQSIV